MNKTHHILQDNYGRQHNYLRISLTEKCNLRCTYCMPEEGVLLTPKKKIMTVSEIVQIAKIFVANGVDKIRLTGGEPLLRRDFTEITKELSQLPTTLSVTTNGILVDKFIDVFRESDITNINVSLDTLKKEKFVTITKRNLFQKAFDNIQLLINEGFCVKINIVLIKGFNDDEIIDFVELTKKENLSIRFIEFMPFNGNHWDKSKLVSQTDIIRAINAYYGSNTIQTLPNEINYTSKNYRLAGYKGNFGIISSISNPFCHSCNRIRLTANGAIKNCLFSNDEIDLLTPFRNGDLIEDLIAKAIHRKKKIRAGMDSKEKIENAEYNSNNRSMITIGG